MTTAGQKIDQAKAMCKEKNLDYDAEIKKRMSPNGPFIGEVGAAGGIIQDLQLTRSSPRTIDGICLGIEGDGDREAIVVKTFDGSPMTLRTKGIDDLEQNPPARFSHITLTNVVEVKNAGTGAHYLEPAKDAAVTCSSEKPTMEDLRSAIGKLSSIVGSNGTHFVRGEVTRVSRDWNDQTRKFDAPLFTRQKAKDGKEVENFCLRLTLRDGTATVGAKLTDAADIIPAHPRPVDEKYVEALRAATPDAAFAELEGTLMGASLLFYGGGGNQVNGEETKPFINTNRGWVLNEEKLEQELAEMEESEEAPEATVRDKVLAHFRKGGTIPLFKGPQAAEIAQKTAVEVGVEASALVDELNGGLGELYMKDGANYKLVGG